MTDLEIDDFEETEYRLDEIGLIGFTFCIEKEVRYLAGDNFYVEYPFHIEQFGDKVIIFDEDNRLELTAEQFEILKSLII